MSHNLEFLLSNFNSLPRSGPKMVQMLSFLTSSNKIIDLLYHFPARIVAKKYLPALYDVKDKEDVILKVRVESHTSPDTKRQPFKVLCYSPSGYLTLTFFKTYPGYIQKNFAIGSDIVVSGKVDCYRGEKQMSHPEYVVLEKFIDQIPKIEIIYPLTYGFTQKLLRSKINQVFEKTPDLAEWIDDSLINKYSWPSWKESLTILHNPKNDNDFEPNNKARRRLAYDELLAFAVTSLVAKSKVDNENGRQCQIAKELRNKLLKSLPFELTAGQKQVLSQIDEDMNSLKRMSRLLQGDVGSGKTIVSLMAMLSAVENKRQAAIIVPIGLLAEQHFKNFTNLLQDLDVRVEILTSKTTKKNKGLILKDLEKGEIDIIVGTHSLLSDDVIFKDLSLITIDEQHRFGVLQRLKLIEKGNKADILFMSATPIPRSLMITLYGDMDISSLTEKPFGRAEINTSVTSVNRIDDVCNGISRAIDKGEKIFWICPLIEESEELDFADVEERFETLKGKFGDEKVAIIHGKMKDKEKDKVMEGFSKEDSEVRVLIATTVIEVGIDISDATIIVIENSEKFGLSQLHQLRGRVGRGDKKSYCVLLYGYQTGVNGKKRLAIMKETNDGFKIAEEDLKIRGFGQIFGTKQSGLPDYKVADLVYDSDLLNMSHRAAQLLINKDPELEGENGKKIRVLLELFGYDKCWKY